MAAKEDRRMDTKVVEVTLKMHVAEMRTRLDQAATIAKAAEACAEAGNVSKAIEIALDIEQILYEVTTLLNAASMMRRIQCIDES